MPLVNTFTFGHNSSIAITDSTLSALLNSPNFLVDSWQDDIPIVSYKGHGVSGKGSREFTIFSILLFSFFFLFKVNKG